MGECEFGDVRISSRFWDRCKHASDRNCWVWTGKYNGDVPFFRIDKVSTSARRYAHTVLISKLDTRVRLLPTCGTRGCCNPAHARTANPNQKSIYNKEYQRSWSRKNRDKYREFGLLRRYRMTFSQFQKLKESQDGLCAVCLVPFEEGKRETRPCVDHCHNSGMIRGLLCHTCNSGLGMMKDNPEILRRAIAYLDSARGNAP
jgi:RNA polymerase-binding transcription factor DksA